MAKKAIVQRHGNPPMLRDYTPPQTEEEARERIATVEKIISEIESTDPRTLTPEQMERARWALYYRNVERRRLIRAFEELRRTAKASRPPAPPPRPPRDPLVVAAHREEIERITRERAAWWEANGLIVAREAYGVLCDILRNHPIELSEHERERFATLQEYAHDLPRGVKKAPLPAPRRRSE